jgi:hypothetical protein
MSDSNDTIRQVVESVKRDYFTADYKASDAEAMGIVLAQFFSWDGLVVLEAAEHGLTDANFHSLCGRVEKLREAEVKRIDKQLKAQAARGRP